LQRRWLILSAIALAIGGGIAAVVVLTTDNGGKKKPRVQAAARLRLPAAERIGGVFDGAATAPGSRSAQASSALGRQVKLGGELSSEFVEAYALRAYPSTRITAQRAQVARQSFEALPFKLAGKQPNVTSKLALTNQWALLGPTRALETPYDFTNLPNRPTVVSGRITTIAVGSKCVPGNCRVYAGSAGGGVWRTNDALAKPPAWQSVSDGLTSISIGSLAIDRRDPTGNTVYAGTGDPVSGADSEAGLGVFKTTDGGASWTLLAGSQKFAKDRAVAAIVLDPRNSSTIYFATFAALHGSSSVNGVLDEPPNAPPLGVYKSTDGGATFTLLFKSPTQQKWSGIKDLALDPNDPDAVFASASGVGPGLGLFRSSKKADGDTDFHLIFRPSDPSHYGYDFVHFALADLGAKTRIYVADSDPVANPDQNESPQGSAHVYRLDNAAAKATAVLAAHAARSGWVKLSSNSITKPGYGAYRYCQTQCDYSNAIGTPPGKPNELWLGGTFDYAGDEFHQRDWNNGRAVVRSTDAGATWNDMTGDTESPPYLMHPDVHAFAFSPNNPEIAFIGSDGGLVRTSGTYTNQGKACTTRGLTPNEFKQCKGLLKAVPTKILSLNKNLSTLQFQSVSVSPAGQPLELLGGTQDNGTWAFTKNDWIAAAGGDGGQSIVGKGVNPVHIHTYHGPVLRVNYHGFAADKWRYIYPVLTGSGERASFYVPLISDPETAGVLYVGLQHVWRTSQYGGSAKVLDDNCDGVVRLEPTCGQWVALGQDLTSTTFGTDRTDQNQLNYVAAIARAPGDSSTLWAATTYGRVFVAQNADGAAKAVSFTRIDIPSTTTKKGTPGRFVSTIVVDPTDPLHAWVAYSGYNAYTQTDQAGHVFEVRVDGTTGKATWTNRSYDLGDQPITGLARDTATGDLYASTDFGVLRLPNGATSWTEAAKGLPLVAVYGLTPSGDGATLYAATHGRGVWQLKLH
jgi:hypothetical protein